MSTTPVDSIDLPGEMGTRSGCEAFELAADIASAGALDAVARAQLETHLAACPSCRSYRDRSGAATAIVASTSATMNLTPARWQEIEARLTRMSSSPWRWLKPLVYVLALMATTWIVTSVVMPGPLVVAPVVFMMVLTIAWSLPIALRRHTRLRREMRVHDVMAVYRLQLQHTVKSYRWMRVLWLGLAVLQVRALVVDHSLWSLVMVGLFLYCFWSTFPAARETRRAIAELS